MGQENGKVLVLRDEGMATADLAFRRSDDLATDPLWADRQINRLVIVFQAQVGNQFLALQMAQGVLQFHQLDEQIMLGI